jgi:hypothetical protein
MVLVIPYHQEGVQVEAHQGNVPGIFYAVSSLGIGEESPLLYQQGRAVVSGMPG